MKKEIFNEFKESLHQMVDHSAGEARAADDVASAAAEETLRRSRTCDRG
jgi:hypothetical protein